MTDHLGLRPHKVAREDRPDGSILLRSGYELGPVARSTGEWLDHWAAATATALFLAERDGDGWRELTYGDARRQVRAIAGHLLSRDLGPDRPILILSGNGIDHALLALAAQYVGIPTVPVAEQYSLIPAALGRLSAVVRLVAPGMVFAADAIPYSAAMSLPELVGVERADSGTLAGWMADTAGTDVDLAAARVGPDTLAKILMTSGSTSDPKGVLTTQRMMTTNQAQVAQALPFLNVRPPKLVDWLPWNHVFGGSYTFNLVLAHGGTMYIDDGKPAPGLMSRTLENLSRVPGTLSFNVPVGFAQLVTSLERDRSLRETYFADLDMIFYAGASLPQETWAALERLSLDTCGQLPLITSSWGLTETAPGAMIQHEPGKGAGIVGVPMAGVEVKLVPDEMGRFDVRVRGDNITRGYLNDPAKTAEAFDDERFFKTGDAMAFVDPEDITKGLRFEGRLSEDFKLMTGTRVRASDLRLELLGVLSPYVADLVLTGEGREVLGALLFPNRAAIEAEGWEMREEGGAIHCTPLMEVLQMRLAQHGDGASGSAAQVRCALVLAEPPSMGEGEATAKGNLNFARIQALRSGLIDRMYTAGDPARLTV